MVGTLNQKSFSQVIIEIAFQNLNGFIFQVEDNLVKVRSAGTEQDLDIQYKALKPEVDKLNIMAAKRQQVLHS